MTAGFKTVVKHNLLVKKNDEWVRVDSTQDIRTAFNWIKRNKAAGNHVRFVTEEVEVAKSWDELTKDEMKAIEDACPQCILYAAVSHFNCSYGGSKIGHSRAHCSADACL